MERNTSAKYFQEKSPVFVRGLGDLQRFGGLTEFSVPQGAKASERRMRTCR